MNAPRIYPLGENALVCEALPPVTLDVQRRVWTVADAARAWPGVCEVVPGMNNLTVIFDSLTTDAHALAPQLTAAWQRADAAPATGREVEIPVTYGGANGPDLEAVAQYTGLTPDEVVRRHTAGHYVVFFLGFKPGFAYLGGLDPALHAPRRAQPRLAVPAGAVGIGGAQTGIYPAASPGGWQLIGRTRLALFDPARTPPTLLLPGDRVRFTVTTQAARGADALQGPAVAGCGLSIDDGLQGTDAPQKPAVAGCGLFIDDCLRGTDASQRPVVAGCGLSIDDGSRGTDALQKPAVAGCGLSIDDGLRGTDAPQKLAVAGCGLFIDDGLQGTDAPKKPAVAGTTGEWNAQAPVTKELAAKAQAVKARTAKETTRAQTAKGAQTTKDSKEQAAKTRNPKEPGKPAAPTGKKPFTGEQTAGQITGEQQP